MKRVGRAEIQGMKLWMRMLRELALLAMCVSALPGYAAGERAIKARVPPVYPELAKRLKVEGVVRLEATVDPDGKVKDVKATKGNQMLSIAAEQAVRKWRFAPGPDETSESVEVTFTIEQ